MPEPTSRTGNTTSSNAMPPGSADQVAPGRRFDRTDREDLLQWLRTRLQYGLPQTLDLEVVDVAEGRLVMQMTIQDKHLAVNGYLHAGSVVTLADTSCGFGCITHLPPEAVNFTTVELKSNFLGTATAGILRATAELCHAGRTTQVWDATVQREDASTVALFRCTQIILYAR